MNQAKLLTDTVGKLFANGKGLLAMDESNLTCNKRFASVGIVQSEEMRRAYREMLVTAPDLAESVGGAILYDETIHQTSGDGTPLLRILIEKGIIPGIKVDTGAKAMAGFHGEKITEGLDGLRDRLTGYFRAGARFAKWRAVLSIGDGNPSSACVNANASALAHYSALCQEVGLVPIVEPEVLMVGTHSLERCREITENVLRQVFNQLSEHRVLLEGLILKPNIVLAGSACANQATVNEVANATVSTLLRCVPAAVPAIAFLSGGQSPEQASERLNAIINHSQKRAPWILAFSFARAIQQPALEIWRGDKANTGEAQRMLTHRARCNRAARYGEYSSAMDEFNP